MALTSSSTLTDALAQYNDNLDWQGSVAKAKLALEAVRFMLVNRPARMSDSGRQFDYESLATEKKALESFVSAADSTVRQQKSSFTRARMKY